MTYGQKLKQIMQIYTEAGIEPGSKHTPDELVMMKEHLCDLLDSIRSQICVAIDGESLPKVEISSYDDMDWLLNADQGKGPFQDLWVQELEWYASENLDIKLKKAHDGGGEKEWLVIKATPTEPDFAPSRM